MKWQGYTCGSMQFLKDGGKSWRDIEIKWASEYDVFLYSPPDHEPKVAKKFNVSTDVLIANPDVLRPKFRKKIFSEIRITDLLWITEHADFLIVNYTQPSSGTISEITWAATFPLILKKVYGIKRKDIPVHLVNINKLPVPSWVESCCESIHPSFESLHRHLIKKYKLKRIEFEQQKVVSIQKQ